MILACDVSVTSYTSRVRSKTGSGSDSPPLPSSVESSGDSTLASSPAHSSHALHKQGLDLAAALQSKISQQNVYSDGRLRVCTIAAIIVGR